MLNKKRSYEVVGIFLSSKDRQANKCKVKSGGRGLYRQNFMSDKQKIRSTMSTNFDLTGRYF